MEFAAEWKSLWPISSTFAAPLLIPNKSSKTPFGPLIFRADPNSSTTLFHSPSLSPQLPPPYPQLPLSRFMQNYNSVPFSATSISSLLGHQLPDYSSYFHGFNSLQLLQIPTKNLIVAFFPTGEDSDHVGFSLLSAKDGSLNVLSQREDLFKVVKEGSVNHHRITRLLVNPIDDFCGDVNGDVLDKHNNVVTVGFLMVCTNYSVYWYKVGITKVGRQDEYSVCLDYLGCANLKMLRGNAVVSACWSPHLREECCVLLENGDLLLFDVNYYHGKKAKSISLFSGNDNIFKKIMQVSLTDELKKEENRTEGWHWFECEFSWHPRIFIASHRDEVLLVDLRSSGVCNISCLLKLEMLSVGKKDVFFALSRAGSDGFTFTLATRSLLLLFDVRKPLMPILRWAHGIQNPRYMTVFRLSELRANAEDNKYKLASESGYCVMLGSFWDNEFNLFFYGPDVNKNDSVSSEISKFCNINYAWGLPSELSLSSSDCKCGSCLVREEFLQASLPVWIDWRQKKHLNLGFGILKPSLSAKFSPDSFGGFMLIRLTSSGKLETQQYFAASESKNILESGHKRKKCYSEDNLLFDCSSSEHDVVKKFQHLKLEFFNAYLEGKLAKCVAERRVKRKNDDEDAPKLKSKSESEFHEEICQRLKAFGLPREQSSCAVSAVLKDICLPTSIHEIAVRSMCAVLPTNLLQLAFSTYKDFDEDHENHEEPLEFLDIPEQLQVPPFPFRKPSNRSNKWSKKVERPDAIVGPILPPLFLTTLHKLCLEELKEERELYLEESKAFSPQTQLKDQCDKVVEVVKEHFSGADEDEDFVCLGDDTQDMSYVTEKPKFSCHKPSSFLENLSNVSLHKPGSDYMFSTHVFRRSQELATDISAEMDGPELFDVACPIELKFNDGGSIKFGTEELVLFQNLKKQDLDFQRSFKPYQDYIYRKDELKFT